LARHSRLSPDLQSEVCVHDWPGPLSPGGALLLLLLPHATSKAPAASESPPKDKTMRPLMFMVTNPSMYPKKSPTEESVEHAIAKPSWLSPH
jgi:hypothetical protein